jgi:hypothetical protein
VSKEIEPLYRVAVQDGRLVLMRLKRDPDTLEPRTRDVFSGEVGTIRFTRDSNNHISGFLLSTGRIRNSDSCAKNTEIKSVLLPRTNHLIERKRRANSGRIAGYAFEERLG